jgi:hypothetical protein
MLTLRYVTINFRFESHTSDIFYGYMIPFNITNKERMLHDACYVRVRSYREY